MTDFRDWLATGWDKIVSDPGTFVPGMLAGLLAGILVILLVFLSKKLWRGLGRLARKILLFIATLPGFRWLAIRVYRRKLQATHGKVTNIYLDRVDELDLEKIFVPLTLHQRASRGNGKPRYASRRPGKFSPGRHIAA